MEQTTLKSRPTEEEEGEDIQFWATKFLDLQSETDSGVGSSSTCEGSSSSNNKNKFHVFISHRGPDTKDTLASQMYDMLHDRGVGTFLDREELQRGQEFPKAIEEAVTFSTVDVCILSSGYAESAWCLKELEMMLGKYEEGKSKLIPVFYDVKPSEVRHLQGAFGQGFQKLIRKGQHSNEVIDKWKQSLCKIGKISGYEGKGERCRTIVMDIHKQLVLLDVGSVATSRKVFGMQEQLFKSIDDIMRCREKGLGVTSVEISGIGGIGKTTFAKELYDRFYCEYERCCFIEDVSGLVEKHGAEEVHTQLIRKLFKCDLSYLKMEGKKVLEKRLQNAEILLVLDNIHSKIHLNTVFIEDDVSLSPKSIIIVTSREDGVLKHDPSFAQYCKNLISVKISTLNFHASKQLFLEYAFKGIDNGNNEFDEMINKIVEKCHGMPLALIILGRQVYGRDMKSWKNIYNSIKDSLHPDLQKILKVTYSNLETELEQCLFLDVATFFYREKVDHLVEFRQELDDEDEDGDGDGESEVLYALDDEDEDGYGDGKSKVLYALDKLKDKFLIEVKDGLLNMHGVLVELGKSIIKAENSCPGHRSRVWHASDI